MILQRGLVGVRLRLSDEDFPTKYTFPFVDSEWKVSFVVVDVLGRGPRILRGPVRHDGSRLVTDRSAAELAPVESVPSAALEGLVHFDPWWDFRGVARVPRDWIGAALSSNIARPFKWNGRDYKVRDLEFDDGLGSLRAVIAQDDRFQRVWVRKGEIDLLGLRSTRPRLVST